MAPSSEPSYPSGLVWFRRDLRANDQAALYRALTQCQEVHCAFVFDREILDALPRADRRVEFIRESLVELDETLRTLSGHEQGGLIVLHAVASDAIPELANALGVQAVFANHDDEPLALARDIQVRGHLADHGIVLHTFKDHVVFERNEVLTQMAKPFSVFTPYKNAWLKKVTPDDLQAFEVAPLAGRLAPRPDDLALESAAANWSTAHWFAARAAGRAADPLAADYPCVEDGAEGVRFIEKVVESAASERKWTALADSAGLNG